MSELKPCPFCGESHAVLLKPTCKQTDAYDSHDRAFPMVCCPLCNAEKHGENWDQSGESAIKAWNTRTVDAELTAAKARIAELEADREETASGNLKAIKFLVDRIDALENALEPFSELGESYDESFADDDEATFADDELTVGDLRRAAALLKEPTND